MTPQDYLLIIYFLQEKKHMSLVAFRFSASTFMASPSLGEEIMKNFQSLCSLLTVVVMAIHTQSCSLSFLMYGGLSFTTQLKVSPCDLLWPMKCEQKLEKSARCIILSFPVMVTR